VLKLRTNSDQVENRNDKRDNLAVIREYTRAYSAQTARANAIVKMAGVLAPKKDEVLPIWKELLGVNPVVPISTPLGKESE
jgi:hypothetical protein